MDFAEGFGRRYGCASGRVYRHRHERQGSPGHADESPQPAGQSADRRQNGGSCVALEPPFWRRRSEEHTSELQSLTNLVCRLLLEKKKKKTRKGTSTGPSSSASS